MRMISTLSCLAVAMTGTSAFLHWLDPSATSTLAERGSQFAVQTLEVDEAGEPRLIAQAIHSIDDGVEIRSGSRPILRRGSTVSLGEWDEVRVVGGPATLTGPMLTATRVGKRAGQSGTMAARDPNSWHFRVRQDGRVDVGTMWRQQLPVAIAGATPLPNTICVQVSGVAAFDRPALRAPGSLREPAMRELGSLRDVPSAQQLSLRSLLAGLSRIVTPAGPPLPVRVGSFAG